MHINPGARAATPMLAPLRRCAAWALSRQLPLARMCIPKRAGMWSHRTLRVDPASLGLAESPPAAAAVQGATATDTLRARFCSSPAAFVRPAQPAATDGGAEASASAAANPAAAGAAAAKGGPPDCDNVRIPTAEEASSAKLPVKELNKALVEEIRRSIDWSAVRVRARGHTRTAPLPLPPVLANAKPLGQRRHLHTLPDWRRSAQKPCPPADCPTCSTEPESHSVYERGFFRGMPIVYTKPAEARVPSPSPRGLPRSLLPHVSCWCLRGCEAPRCSRAHLGGGPHINPAHASIRGYVVFRPFLSGCQVLRPRWNPEALPAHDRAPPPE